MNKFNLFLFVSFSVLSYGQEKLWTRFSPQELSDCLLQIKPELTKSFRVKTSLNDRIIEIETSKDSLLTEKESGQKYVIRENLVLPILPKADSSDIYKFLSKKLSVKSDSLHYQVEKFYDLDNMNNAVLTFKIAKTTDTTFSSNYEIPTWELVESKQHFKDSSINKSTWLIEGNSTTFYETTVIKQQANKNYELTQKTYSERKEEEQEPLEQIVYTIERFTKENGKTDKLKLTIQKDNYIEWYEFYDLK